MSLIQDKVSSHGLACASGNLKGNMKCPWLGQVQFRSTGLYFRKYQGEVEISLTRNGLVQMDCPVIQEIYRGSWYFGYTSDEGHTRPVCPWHFLVRKSKGNLTFCPVILTTLTKFQNSYQCHGGRNSQIFLKCKFSSSILTIHPRYIYIFIYIYIYI